MYLREVSTAIANARISVRGIVQGVGFRPFVYQRATMHNLTGWVCNTSGDVAIEAEGPEETIRAFVQEIETQAPPLAVIEHVACSFQSPRGYQRFEIKESKAEKGKYQRISPDIATCSLCLQEVLDGSDRRSRYPFTNCTNCGPRFTIIKDIPYDRPETTMRRFTMCPRCQIEYDNPLDRRFHAQPNCCPVCGPQLELTDAAGVLLSTEDPIAAAASFIKEGQILAIKGLGGFLLAADSTSEQAVQLLRERKRRPFKPFAVMMRSVEEIKQYCSVSTEEERLLTSTKAPIVLLRINGDHLLAAGVAPKLNYLGVMLPYTPLHHVLVREAAIPLIMTSGNLSEEPIAKDNDEALRRLAGIADYFLLHNRDIYVQFDDSVTLVEHGVPRVARRARSYAPDPIHLPFETTQVLACGPELKNTFCMTKDHYAFISQHIGDLDSLETLLHFEKILDHYRNLFRLHPIVVAHDKHPDYLSTRYAQELKVHHPEITLIPVQHHHAHIVSCITENQVSPPVLGVSFDGTGYGDDGCIWGGELLLVHYDRFERLGHLEYVPLPGGEAAIRKPYRMALSYLATLLGEEVFKRSLPFFNHVPENEVAIVRQQVAARLNAPLTSSSGRLFDAVSALLGICHEVDYEGQAAVELEMAAGDDRETTRLYPCTLEEDQGRKVVRLRGIFEGILEDMEQRVPITEIALIFHHTVARIIAAMCRLLARETGLQQAALSGGVFQNRLLLGLSRRYLQAEGMNVIAHQAVPTNDGGISLGQAVIAHFKAGEHRR